MDDQEVTEYYHRGVVCHLIGQDLAIPLDVELQRPGEGEVPAAKRLLERVFANYPRYFDAVVGDGLYLEAPFINFCREHHKHVVVVVKGEQRLLLQDAKGLFSQRGPDGQWSEGRRVVQYWEDDGFTSCEGVDEPLRVLHTLETERRRERIAREWKQTEQTSSWYWATTFSRRQLSAREFWRAGHWRWDIENDCFNSTSTHWGLDHAFRHEPTAIVNFVLTLFLAFVLLQCFWRRNLKPALRDRFTLIGLAAETLRSFGQQQARRRAKYPARPRAIVCPPAGRRALHSSYGSRAVGTAPPRHLDPPAAAGPGIPPSSRDSGTFTPLGKCPATIFRTPASHWSAFSGRFSSRVTPTNHHLRNCCLDRPHVAATWLG